MLLLSSSQMTSWTMLTFWSSLQFIWPHMRSWSESTDLEFFCLPVPHPILWNPPDNCSHVCTQSSKKVNQNTIKHHYFSITTSSGTIRSRICSAGIRLLQKQLAVLLPAKELNQESNFFIYFTSKLCDHQSKFLHVFLWATVNLSTHCVCFRAVPFSPKSSGFATPSK